MKNLFLALAVYLSAVTAFGGNEGPSADKQMQPAKTIAEVSQSSGLFHPPDAPSIRVVDVLSDGRVVLTERYTDGKVTTEDLATLGSQVLAKLQANVNGVSGSKIVDPNPGSGCQDAPSTEYFAIKNGKRVLVQEEEGCKTLRGEKANSADATVANTLKGLFDLAWIQAPNKSN